METIWIIIIVVLFIVFIVFIVVMVVMNNNEDEDSGGSPGDACSEDKKCNSGLVCENSVCVIPVDESCRHNESFCASGLKCVSKKCVVDEKLENIRLGIQSSNNASLIKSSQYKDLYLATSLEEEKTHFYSGAYNDCFFYDNLVYIVQDKSMRGYDMNGNLVREYTSNIPISSNVEVANNKLYTVFNKKLHSSSMNNLQLSFFPESDVLEIVPDNAGTQLYKRSTAKDPYIILGSNGSHLLKTNTHITYEDVTVPHNNKHPIIYNDNAYLMDNRTKVYNNLLLTTI